MEADPLKLGTEVLTQKLEWVVVQDTTIRVIYKSMQTIHTVATVQCMRQNSMIRIIVNGGVIMSDQLQLNIMYNFIIVWSFFL